MYPPGFSKPGPVPPPTSFLADARGPTPRGGIGLGFGQPRLAGDIPDKDQQDKERKRAGEESEFRGERGRINISSAMGFSQLRRDGSVGGYAIFNDVFRSAAEDAVPAEEPVPLWSMPCEVWQVFRYFNSGTDAAPACVVAAIKMTMAMCADRIDPSADVQHVVDQRIIARGGDLHEL